MKLKLMPDLIKKRGKKYLKPWLAPRKALRNGNDDDEGGGVADGDDDGEQGRSLISSVSLVSCAVPGTEWGRVNIYQIKYPMAFC